MEKFPWGELTKFELKLNANNPVASGLQDLFCIPKIHTIRPDEKNRWKPGMKVHAFYHSRTPQMRKIWEGKCISVQKIRIIYYDKIRVKIYIDKKRLKPMQIRKLIVNDGIDSMENFFRWFNKDFHGKIIHFTDFRY